MGGVRLRRFHLGSSIANPPPCSSASTNPAPALLPLPLLLLQSDHCHYSHQGSLVKLRQVPRLTSCGSQAGDQCLSKRGILKIGDSARRIRIIYYTCIQPNI